jgi:hypothetical protein
VSSIADYWPRIERIPLYRDIELDEAWLCRTATREPVRVTKPEFFKTDGEREAAITFYQMFYGTN